MIRWLTLGVVATALVATMPCGLRRRAPQARPAPATSSRRDGCHTRGTSSGREPGGAETDKRSAEQAYWRVASKARRTRSGRSMRRFSPSTKRAAMHRSG